MKAIDIIEDAARTLRDRKYVRWTKEDHYKFLTAAKRSLVIARPDAKSITRSVRLAPYSTRQEIPEDGFALIDIVRNMGADGLQPGYPVSVVGKADIDAAIMNWHYGESSSQVDNFCFDERNSRFFYVYPVPGDLVHVEMVFSQYPTIVTGDDDVIDVEDVFYEPLLAYCLYRAFSVNNDSSADMEKAKSYLASFFTMIGQESQAAGMVSPNVHAENPDKGVQ